jgi:hypothetical protein
MLKNWKSAVSLNSNTILDREFLHTPIGPSEIKDRRSTVQGTDICANVREELAILKKRWIESYCRHNISQSESSNEQEAVLVDIVKFAEHPERIISTLVRLDRVENLFRSRADSLYFSDFGGFVSGFIIADGKHWVGKFGRLLPVSIDQLPNQMIQCTSQVMERISYDQRDAIGRLLSDFNPMNFISCLRIVLNDKTIRICIPECVQDAFGILGVVFGPF